MSVPEKLACSPCPLRPEPDLGEALLVEGVLQEVDLHQPLEEAALMGCGVGDSLDVVQCLLEVADHSLCLQVLWLSQASMPSHCEPEGKADPIAGLIGVRRLGVSSIRAGSGFGRGLVPGGVACIRACCTRA